LVVAFIDALRAVAKQMQQDAIADPPFATDAKQAKRRNPT
jgi:hypothetical protein